MKITLSVSVLCLFINLVCQASIADALPVEISVFFFSRRKKQY